MIIRFLRWVVHKLGIKPILYIALLLLGVGSAALGLADIIKGLELELAIKLVSIGVGISWITARTRIKNWVGLIFLITIGLIVLVTMVGDLWGPIIGLFRATDYLIWEILHLESDVPIDLTNIKLAYSEVSFGISSILVACGEWIKSIRDGLPFFEETVISLVWGAVIWLMACWAGWVIQRYRRPLMSIIPTGIILSSTAAYAWAGTSAFIPLIFSALLLMALTNYDLSENEWHLTKMDYPEDLSREFGLTAVVMNVGIVTLAALVPIISIENIMEIAQKFTKPQIEEAEPVIQSFGLNQGSIPQEDIGKAIRGGFPRGHLMGSGPELSEKVVMTVEITGGMKSETGGNIILPLYWRSLTYDDYFGFGWRSSDIILRSYKAGEEVSVPNEINHQVIQIDVRMAKGETKFLYAPGEILTADDEFKIAYRPTVRYTEVHKAHGDFFGASIDQSSYRVQSVIPVVSSADLRNAQGEYPEWVIERYLQLPDSIPSRVYQLADELTKDDKTQFDQAKTLEGYLRDFEYSLDVDMPSLRQDMVDYFLFDLHKGYCDYYATSMVVMARSLGIPSRLTIGYYRGKYDQINNRYIVTEADAHSWVEVYFPEIGWVPFEPTAGRAEIERMVPAFLDTGDIDDVEELPPLIPWFALIRDSGIKPALYLLIGIPAIILAFFIFDEIRLRRMPSLLTISTLFQRLYRLGNWVQVDTVKGNTPLEFAQMLSDRLELLSQRGIFKKFIGTSTDYVYDITKIYTFTLYGPGTPDMEDRKRMLILWRRLKRRLWLASVQQLMPKTPKSRPVDGKNGELQ